VPVAAAAAILAGMDTSPRHSDRQHHSMTQRRRQGGGSSNQCILLRNDQRARSTTKWLDGLLGGVTVGLFILVWVGSLVSPVILVAAAYYKVYSVVAMILAVSLAAYLPWEKGGWSHTITAFVDHYHPRYYASCRTMAVSSRALSRNSHTLYAVHPHGAFCLGWSTLSHAPFMKTVRFCLSPALYCSPFFHLWARVIGRPGRADKPFMIRYMERGENMALPPGGFEEATLTCRNQDRVYIKNRAGFVKLCLTHGYAIVPVYCFGETSTFYNVQGFWNTRLWLNGYGIPGILVWGATFLPFLPKRSAHLLVVLGDPIECPKIASPTNQDVEQWHARYIASLQTLFEAYHEEAMYKKDAKLEIW
jgi:Diacylglycerol acyltransferase